MFCNEATAELLSFQFFPNQRARLQRMSVEEAEYLDEDRLEVALLEEAAEGRNMDVRLVLLDDLSHVFIRETQSWIILKM